MVIKKKEDRNSKQVIAISQIFLLLLQIFAISFIISTSMSDISAYGIDKSKITPGTTPIYDTKGNKYIVDTVATDGTLTIHPSSGGAQSKVSPVGANNNNNNNNYPGFSLNQPSIAGNENSGALAAPSTAATPPIVTTQSGMIPTWFGGYRYDPTNLQTITSASGAGYELFITQEGNVELTDKNTGQKLTDPQITSLANTKQLDLSGVGESSLLAYSTNNPSLSYQDLVREYNSGNKGLSGGWSIAGESHNVVNGRTSGTITLKNDYTGQTKTLNYNNPQQKVGNEIKKQYVSAPNTGTSAGVHEYETIFGKTADPFWGNIGQGAQWGTIVLTTTQLLGNFIKGEKGQQLQDIGLAVAAGVFAGKATAGIFSIGMGKEQTATALSKWRTPASWIIGALVTYYLLAQVTKTSTRESTIEFKCMSWQAARGGDDCTKCNDDPLRPCSEYRCKALGQTCMLINKGTGFEKCIDSGRDDTTSPGIKPWKEKLTVGYEYADVKPRPAGSSSGSSGMRIVDKTNPDGCLKAFTPFTFGIETTEKDSSLQPAQCKIDFNHTTKFDEMQYYLGESNIYEEQHEQTMALPGTDALNKILEEANGTLNVKNDGEYSLYHYDYAEICQVVASEEYV